MSPPDWEGFFMAKRIALDFSQFVGGFCTRAGLRAYGRKLIRSSSCYIDNIIIF